MGAVEWGSSLPGWWGVQGPKQHELNLSGCVVATPGAHRSMVHCNGSPCSAAAHHPSRWALPALSCGGCRARCQPCGRPGEPWWACQARRAGRPPAARGHASAAGAPSAVGQRPGCQRSPRRRRSCRPPTSHGPRLPPSPGRDRWACGQGPGWTRTPQGPTQACRGMRLHRHC